MPRWLETDSLSNQDISAATAIGAYTADADRLVLCQILVDQVAGNGDYIFYLTLQVAGAGSSYRFIPVTTAAAASGLTAIGAQSVMIAVRSADVVTAYIDGLAGDTTTPDTAVRWFEVAALRPTTADRTLDVTATGEAGVDWANVGTPGSTVNLSATTIKTATDVETDTAQIGAAGAGLSAVPWNAAWDAEVQSEAADALNAYDPPTKAELDAGFLAQQGADSDTLETLSDQIDGVSAANVWGYATRTLTQTAASVASTVDGSSLTIRRGDSFSAAITGLGSIAARSKMWFTVKRKFSDADTASLVMIDTATGLVYLNGAVAGTAANGAITVDDEDLGNITITLDEVETAKLSLYEGLTYDVQMLTTGGAVTTLTEGPCVVIGDVTRAVT